MTERERRPEGRDDDDTFRLDLSARDAGHREEEAVGFKEVTAAKPLESVDTSATFERQMKLGRASMRKHRNVLAVLAK